MGSRFRSFITEPNLNRTTTEDLCICENESGTSNNYSSSSNLDFPSSSSSRSAGRSQFSDDAVSDVVDENENPMAVILRTPSLQEFSFRNLEIATNNFSTENLIGEGGFGRVYKGWVDEKTLAPSSIRGTGIAVAIKILSCDGHQGFDEWQQSQVNLLGRHYHPNIIGLLGYCWENQKLGLVYEFMQKGSLENRLFGRTPGVRPLSWGIRLKIVIGAGRGLAFLHTLEKKVIYRDFKASNILLDKNYNAKLSDFGLAMFGPLDEEAPISVEKVLGTYGYAAPEYVSTGNIYMKSDVYGFGVVLLEMLTGLRARDLSLAIGQQNFLGWLKLSLSHNRELESIMDVRMDGQYSVEAAFQVAELTLKCLEPEPQSRPSMKEVVEMLKEIEALDDTAK